VSKKNLLKYIFRFVFIQISTVTFSIWYFDNFLLVGNEDKFLLYQNLVEDWNKFYNFIPLEYVTVDTLIVVIVSIFIIILFTTNFYTYVNELNYTLNKNYLQEFFSIYIMWTAYIFSSFYILRFDTLSRASLISFSFFVPLLLFIFRNSEILLALLGRSPLNEKYVSFNLDDNSGFKKLRILSFRKQLQNFDIGLEDNTIKIIKSIDSFNKKEETNLVVLDMQNLNMLDLKLENYLINLNKKVLLFSRNQVTFNSVFIHRSEKIDNKYVYYFNNDIQYGSKYILKRVTDIFISIFLLILFLPILLGISLFILKIDGGPFLIKQNRVGLHGKKFTMFKFRTMRKDSHQMRKELEVLNKKTGPLFKLENDPRLLRGSKFLRKFSIDELPQLFNVIKGEMSLVGPRPLFEEDTQLFNENYMRRLNVLPGMTGLLQINDRNTDDFDTWFRYDLEYIENWSLYLDLNILLKTIPSMFKRTTSGK
jgi:lipopolysaccharide/colanic/teichoic acid biosynthesis glycosyltransferase